LQMRSSSWRRGPVLRLMRLLRQRRPENQLNTHSCSMSMSMAGLCTALAACGM
jgi:hypothetical protein